MTKSGNQSSITTRLGSTRRGVLGGLAGLGLAATVPAPYLARAQDKPADKVKVGVFPLSSSLPYFVALDKGFFKEVGIEAETIKLMGGPANVAALIGNQIDVSAVLVMLEGMNANVKKPGAATYISCNSQTKVWQMEQFVVRDGFKAESLKDLKGAKLMSAPGPANLNTAKAVLAKAGLKEGDYTIDQLDMGQHINVMKAGTFDGGYTLEPQGTMMRKMGVARTLETGLISKYILGDESANSYAAGCAVTADFIKSRPDVAKRFAVAMAKAIDFINKEPAAARKFLYKNTLTPDDLVDEIPMLGYTMVKDMTPKQVGDWQKLVDFGTEIGVVPEKVDVKSFSAAI
jgi:NitT/TauT family transport system substrate-binding protein